jgi:2-(1,2-epoxy-1,2-dihydrophenyl)acetyl-CoA isomerase
VSQVVLFDLSDGVATITLNRPDRLNALTREVLEGLLDRVTACAEDDRVGCVVLTGAGRAFCSGGDVKDQAARATTGGSPRTIESRVLELRRLADASRILHEMPKPTIAMLNGVAAGAGMSLALACDLRIAGESARMTTAFARVGMSGDYGGAYFLQRLVGPTRARELYFSSEMLDAAKLKELGIATVVVPDAQLQAECRARAAALAAGPRMAFGYMKRNFRKADEGDLAAYLDIECDGMVRTGQSLDHKEAALAFVEKRTPRFQGR